MCACDRLSGVMVMHKVLFEGAWGSACISASQMLDISSLVYNYNLMWYELIVYETSYLDL